MKFSKAHFFLLLGIALSCEIPDPENRFSTEHKILIDRRGIRVNNQGIVFFVIGDWGRNGQFGQSETAKAMAEYASVVRPDFIISTGDNFYPHGVRSITDPQWETSFENIYADASLQLDWWVVLGNHDYEGVPEAQIEYSEYSERWKMPDFYFRKSFYLGSGTDSALFLFLDTNPFETKYYSQSRLSRVRDQDTTAQKEWINHQLGESNHRWKVAIGHHNFYTAGNRHHMVQSNSVRKSLEPVFEEKNLDFYLAGHEHDLQHLRPEHSTVDYFISGAGSELRAIQRPDVAQFSQATNGFLMVSMSNEKAVFQFVDVSGKIIYTYTKSY